MNTRNKVILVTGGTGSFGNHVANYLAGQDPREIIIFSRDENKQYKMQKDYPDYRYIVGDVRDKDRLNYAMKGVDLVFHAAALKQVPSCEANPYEAVKTNVIGTQNACEVAIGNNVEVLVGLSTDKAVKPVNAMGMSKALLEKIICSQNQYPINTRFCCVRYGNVMGSRGSVIPLFKQQIEAGEKITLTVPHMTRFLMTLSESVDLVLYALTQTNGGEIFVKKSPACRIIDLAKTMIRKYGDGDYDRIQVMGIRPGEKIDEVLVNEYEITRANENGSFFEIIPEYKIFTGQNAHPSAYEYTSANTTLYEDYETISHMLDLMGETELYN